ncbi:hypothetical protein EDD99_7156 [Streptomyces sp. 846.5]|nr:hypothetical protein [Streptomyces sp. 846.5]TDT95331.1 hypothetical protein EDD99_7156 [Streptomyces sp. 846.5]
MTITLSTPVADVLTPQQARQGIATARAEKADAEQLAAALEERVRAGQDDITPQQLASAHETARFAALRITAAERRLTAALEADLHARTAEQAERARKLAAEPTDDLVDAFTAAADAISHLGRLAAERHDRIREVGFALRDIEGELNEAGVPGLARVRHGVHSNVNVLHLADQPHPLTAVRPAVLVAAAAFAAAGLTMPADIGELAQELTAGQAIVRRAIAELPQLAAPLTLTTAEWDALDYAGHENANQQGRKPEGAAWPPRNV